MLQDVFEDDRDVHIVMELCDGSALTDAVSAGRLSDERDVAIIVSSILRFIAQCHGKGIVYRDVKPDNFLFVRDETGSPIKATDFGLSIRHSAGEAPLTSRSGTPAYMAPEVRVMCSLRAASAARMHASHLMNGSSIAALDLRGRVLDAMRVALPTREPC